MIHEATGVQEELLQTPVENLTKGSEMPIEESLDHRYFVTEIKNLLSFAQHVEKRLPNPKNGLYSQKYGTPADLKNGFL